jgi:hypothetical protein
VQQPDVRPAFVLDDVNDADLFRIKTPKTSGVPTFVLKNVDNFKLTQSNAVSDTYVDRAENKNL